MTVVSVASLLVVLDLSIVNIALHHEQSDPHISDADRSRVAITYALAFGGLLPLGGRIADSAVQGPVGLLAGGALTEYAGRRWTRSSEAHRARRRSMLRTCGSAQAGRTFPGDWGAPFARASGRL
ncbi:hypothetical protein ACFVHS_14925 [Streptomyces sp. NPDC057746]|uniref:hypothetical protein n=1 Tax=Streptomyces sp. NPDC057746 TaxID=3346237 RepID=UPI003677B507